MFRKNPEKRWKPEITHTLIRVGRDSSDGIATRYGLNPGGGEIFRTRPDRPWGSRNLLYNVYRVIPEGKAVGAWG
jgi:hypothetical protein